jgi:hypothetical protein
MARTPSSPLALVLAAAAASASLAGCADDFTPASVLEDVRVLALLADPLEAGPGDEVAVRAVVYEDPADPVAAESWSFCPLTTGAQGGFRCVVAACETPLGTAREATANPYALAEACVAAAGGTLPDGGATTPAEVESVFRFRATTTGGRVREAVLRLPLRTTPPAERNLPPSLTRVTVGGVPASAGAVAGTVRPGESIAVAAEIDPASLQPYVDGAGRTLTESVVVSFFTTAGRFTDDRGAAPLATTALEARELPAGASQAELWVVARDLRGGQAVAGPFVVAITALAP